MKKSISLRDFAGLTLEEKLEALLPVEGHFWVVGKIEPLGRSRLGDDNVILDEARRALEIYFRRKYYRSLKFLSPVLVLLAMFLVEKVLDLLVPSLPLLLLLGLWTVVGTMSIVLGLRFDVRDSMKVEQYVDLTGRELSQEIERLKEIVLLEQQTRKMTVKERIRLIDRVFERIEARVLREIAKEAQDVRARPGTDFIDFSAVGADFSAVRKLKASAKEDLFSTLLEHKPLLVASLALTPKVAKSMKSRGFRRKESKRFA